jgi:hypothetical protein
MTYPHSRPYAVFFNRNANGSWTAWIGTSSFDGTREECLSWLKNESPAAYGCPDDPFTPLIGIDSEMHRPGITCD